MSTPLDDRGYGILWFVTLFMIAAYIRLYVPQKGNWVKPLIIYVASSVCLFISLPVIGIVTGAVGKMEQYYNVLFEYNAPFTIIGAIALFLAFRNMKIGSEKLSKVINLFAGATFGVYLLHEHTLLRWQWDAIWNIQQYYRTPFFLLNCCIAVLGVYLAGTVVDWGRQLIFAGIAKILRLKKLEEKISVIDKYFNSEPKENVNE